VSGGARLSLTEGTIRALGFMHTYRFLAIAQFARISGVTYKHGAEVLLSLECLEAVGFIGFHSIPGQGKTPKLYFLKHQIFAFLTQATDMPGSEVKSFRETHKDLVWTPAMYHWIRLIDCFLALERGVLVRPQLSYKKRFWNTDVSAGVRSGKQQIMWQSLIHRQTALCPTVRLFSKTSRRTGGGSFLLKWIWGQSGCGRSRYRNSDKASLSG
jgi:hypothetical protein